MMMRQMMLLMVFMVVGVGCAGTLHVRTSTHQATSVYFPEQDTPAWVLTSVGIIHEDEHAIVVHMVGDYNYCHWDAIALVNEAGMEYAYADTQNRRLWPAYEEPTHCIVAFLK